MSTKSTQKSKSSTKSKISPISLRSRFMSSRALLIVGLFLTILIFYFIPALRAFHEDQMLAALLRDLADFDIELSSDQSFFDLQLTDINNN